MQGLLPNSLGQIWNPPFPSPPYPRPHPLPRTWTGSFPPPSWSTKPRSAAAMIQKSLEAGVRLVAISSPNTVCTSDAARTGKQSALCARAQQWQACMAFCAPPCALEWLETSRNKQRAGSCCTRCLARQHRRFAAPALLHGRPEAWSCAECLCCFGIWVWLMLWGIWAASAAFATCAGPSPSCQGHVGT